MPDNIWIHTTSDGNETDGSEIKETITPHKGGRGERVELRLTSEEKGLLDEKRGGKSRSDYIMQKIQETEMIHEINISELTWKPCRSEGMSEEPITYAIASIEMEAGNRLEITIQRYPARIREHYIGTDVYPEAIENEFFSIWRWGNLVSPDGELLDEFAPVPKLNLYGTHLETEKNEKISTAYNPKTTIKKHIEVRDPIRQIATIESGTYDETTFFVWA